MIKRSIANLLIIFCMTFLGNGDVGPCFGDEEFSIPTISLAKGNDVPIGPVTIECMHGVTLPSACLNNENSGGRQISSSIGRLTLLVRLLGVRPNFIPGQFSHTDDIRSWYGPVRPHLYFRRLLI